MFEKVKAENGVVFFRSTLLPCPHGFSTRIGGKSTHEHTSSLNLAFNRGDDREIVLENLELFGQAVGFDCKKTVSLHQIHSARVREVTSEDAGIPKRITTITMKKWKSTRKKHRRLLFAPAAVLLPLPPQLPKANPLLQLPQPLLLPPASAVRF